MFTVKGLITGGRDAMALHESFGKVFRTFQHGTSLRGTDDRDILGTLVSLQIVVDALHQRVLRTNNHHVDFFGNHELLDHFEVISLHGNVDATIAGSGIAGGNKQFLTLLTLGNLPSQGVLATTTT